MDKLKRTLAGLSVCVIALAVGMPTAAACDTFRLLDLQDSVHEADIIVTGTVLDRGPARPVQDYGAGPEGGDAAWITVKVSQVLKGMLIGQTLKIRTDEPCGYGLSDPGLGTFIFFLKRDKMGMQYRRVWAASPQALERGEAGPMPLAVINGRFKFAEDSDWRTVETQMTLEDLVKKISDDKNSKK
ncbi:MAG: hypothetical protein HGA80_05590 [Candidatus Omnitrophica bacterium]|nr:hypothetical protein [Candidatus Omnitrophota bacterium]